MKPSYSHRRLLHIGLLWLVIGVIFGLGSNRIIVDDAISIGLNNNENQGEFDSRSKVELLWNDVNSELLNPESPLSNIRLRQRITALLSLENPEILISSSRALGDRFEYALLRVLLFSDVFYPELAEQCKIAFVELLESKQRHLLRLSSRCDPGSTLTFVLAHSRKDFISEIIHEAAVSKPEATLDIIDRHSIVADENLKAMVANTWFIHDPLAFYNASSNLQLRISIDILKEPRFTRACKELVEQIGKIEAILWVFNNSDDSKVAGVESFAITDVLTSFSELSAADLVAQQAKFGDENNLRNHLFGRLLTTDSLKDLFNTLDSSDSKYPASIEEMCINAGVNLTAQQARAIIASPYFRNDDNMGSSLYREAAKIVATNDYPHFRETLNSNLLDDNRREALIRAGVEALIISDPETAINLSRQFGTDLSGGEWDAIVTGLAWTDPDSVIDAMSDLPESRQSHVASVLSRSWMQVDPLAASQWISELPSGTVRDSAISELIKSLRTKEPDSAKVWLSLIDDQELYDQLLIQLD